MADNFDFGFTAVDQDELILPLLHKLMENEDKEYIYWPNRKAIINQQIERVKKVTRG